MPSLLDGLEEHGDPGPDPELTIRISVRSSYESSVIPSTLGSDKLVRVAHRGFSKVEYKATQTFFEYFGIQHPTVPLLVPEFQNPLFLKIFCLALKNRGLTRVDPGLRGISNLLRFFLDSVNEKLAAVDQLDFDRSSNPVNRAVEKLAEMMAEKGAYLDHGEARDAVNAMLPRQGYEKSLFRSLISEGVLAEERIRSSSTGAFEEVVHFAYERFTDHLVAKYLLDTQVDPGKLQESFSPQSGLGQRFNDEYSCLLNRGLLDALCIQVPERFGRELPGLLQRCAGYQPMREAFIEGLIWRDPHSISGKTLNYINAEVVRYEDSHAQFLNALLTIAAYPEHPYNALFLHSHLMKLSMAQRDAWWSIYLHYHYGEGGAIDRLIDWAWFSKNKSQVDDESTFLTAIAICWFLTSSNRYLRDRSTKALVSLLTPRLPVVKELLRRFGSVNDLYVLERVYAVAYGSALRSIDFSSIAAIAWDVYRSIFSQGRPVPHVLLRDYARGIIETALHNGTKLKIDTRKIRPPYKSTWPRKIPGERELKRKYDNWREGMPEEGRGTLMIYASVMHHDFARYVIGTNSGPAYSSRRLGRAANPTYRERYDQFVNNLSEEQRSALDNYRKELADYSFQKLQQSLTFMKSGKSSEPSVRPPIPPDERALARLFEGKRRRLLTRVALPYLKDPRIDQRSDIFDLRIAQRWILQRVFQLGWTPERFGMFDRNTQWAFNRGRESRKAERMSSF